MVLRTLPQEKRDQLKLRGKFHVFTKGRNKGKSMLKSSRQLASVNGGGDAKNGSVSKNGGSTEQGRRSDFGGHGKKGRFLSAFAGRLTLEKKSQQRRGNDSHEIEVLCLVSAFSALAGRFHDTFVC